MKRIAYFFVGLLLVSASSCKKSFFDINENPNKPTDESVTPNLILPRAQHATAARMATSYNNYAGWMGYWARSGSYGPSTEEESYNITTTFEADEWSGWYDILADFDAMEKKANKGGQGFYEGIAKVMKTIGFMYLVDQYDNVPYSKAFDLSGNILPAYDKGSDIYNDLFVQLDNALQLIDNAAATDDLVTADIMFKGDKTKWKKFINTQRLKLAVRLSNVAGFDGAAQLQKVTAEGFIGSGETAYVQPGYVVDNNRQNPFWNSYEKGVDGSWIDNYNRMNNYVYGLFRNNSDVRYTYFFDAALSPLNGNTYYGYNYGEVIPNTDPKAVNSSGVGGPGLAKSATQPQWIFTSVESLFLQALAIQKGWLAGDARTAYERAVRESFIWLGVANATTEANDYLDQGTDFADWDLATTPEAKLKLIITQKYLALTGINNFEAWVDYRRTGYPNVPLSLSPSRGNNKIPVRIRYPQDEYNYNAANVAAEGTIDPQTKTIFWDK